jgi:hypothetical protein
LTLIACALIGGVVAPAASADRDYTLRFGQVDRGNVAIVANTSMTCPTSVSTCADGRNGTGGDAIRNSMYVMTHVDVDADATTFNSSSADLRLPDGATVLFAGLYWGSDTKAGTGGVDAPDAAAKGTVKFSTTAGWSYQTVTATQIDTSRVFPTRYQGFADVTDRVKAAGPGTYAVANVQAATGSDNFGGWGLVVAYRDPAEGVHWLGVYDGFRQFTDDNVYNTTLGGFRTPDTGTVGADFGMLTYEGDLGVPGDITQLNGKDLSDPLHAAGNYWNSRITDRGQYVHAKNPDYLHQMGHEASVMEIDGYLPNAATSVPLRLGVSTDYLQTGPITLVSDQATSPPSSATAPAISGTARDGETLTASNGTWTGGTPMTFTPQWRRCTTTCTDIEGATGTSYTLAAADASATLRVVVTAKNADGSTAATSAPTETVAARAPVNTALPSVSGTARDGETLTASAGTWNGTPTIGYGFRWRRCAATCADIPGETGSTYALTADDVGKTIRVAITATNDGGSVSAVSLATTVVAAQAPSNSDLPGISGTARDGETLTASTGTWTGTPTIGYAYQWRRCNSGCTDVGTGPSYSLKAADVGATLHVEVTATNGGGSAAAGSAATPVIAARPPVSTALPTVSGTALEGETLTASAGTWTGTPTIGHAYQWRRCAATCTDIAGAEASTYALTADDVGKTIRVAVTGSNGGGSATAVSDATGAILARPPAHGARPAITGTAVDGERLEASAGAWSGTPAFAYQWQRCGDAGCADVDGATATTYDLSPADIGRTMRVTVTATNAGGTGTVVSDPTPTVAARKPASTSGPAITGTPRDGEPLTTSTGEWTGTPAITHTYQWRRCDGDVCTDLPGATSDTYVPTAADVGQQIRVAVTATNAGGSVTASSVPTAAVLARVVPPVEAPPVPKPPMEQPRGEVLSTRVDSPPQPPPACDPLQMTRTHSSRRTTLRLRFRVDRPITSLNLAMPAALLPARTATPRVVGRLRLQRGAKLGRPVALRFQPGLKLALTPGTTPRLRLTRSGARLTGLPRNARLVDLTLYSAPAKKPATATVRAEARTAAGKLLLASCTG